LKEGETIIDAVLEEDPHHRRARSLKGIALFKGDRLDEARTILAEALELNADPARAHYYLGQVYERQGDKDRALEQYRLALRQLLKE
jgi:predicted Zn-dependent protease